jgi:hypothetical protein
MPLPAAEADRPVTVGQSPATLDFKTLSHYVSSCIDSSKTTLFTSAILQVSNVEKSTLNVQKE